MSDLRPYDFADHVGSAVSSWDENAEWWDDRIGDGNDFQTELIEPATHELLSVRPGERVLDIACGAGRVARQLADRGARVLAIDQSRKFLARARERSGDYGDELEFRLLNAADREALLALGEGTFDAAVITMALMSMPVISTPIDALSRLLAPGGRAVFSVLHPAFNSSDSRLHAERTSGDGRCGTSHRVSVSRYTTSYAFRGEGIRGQPALEWYFHRSISTLVNAWLDHGFLLDGLAEPELPEGKTVDPESLSWHNVRDVPPVLVARMRLPRS
jgi:2-polyprenyl-3-methyl-5-hydroxy-6-metoxy-1,4-benzoquinol methylase